MLPTDESSAPVESQPERFIEAATAPLAKHTEIQFAAKHALRSMLVDEASLDSATAQLEAKPVRWKKWLGWSVFAVMFTVFTCGPSLPPESNTTLISPVLPGAMGACGFSGTVQPHEPFASIITRFSLPVFVNLKICVIFSPCLIFPQLCAISSHLMDVLLLAAAAGCAGVATTAGVIAGAGAGIRQAALAGGNNGSCGL